MVWVYHKLGQFFKTWYAPGCSRIEISVVSKHRKEGHSSKGGQAAQATMQNDIIHSHMFYALGVSHPPVLPSHLMKPFIACDHDSQQGNISQLLSIVNQVRRSKLDIHLCPA